MPAEKKNRSDLLRALAAEFIAMSLFVWIGCGTAVASQAIDVFGDAEGTNASFLVATSMAFGLGIAVLAFSIASVSGGHINPAVTTSLVLIGEMHPVTGVFYVITQFIAAVLGAALVWGSMSDEVLGKVPFGVGANFVTESTSLGSAFLIEAIGTFLLLWTVCMTAVYKNSIAGNVAPIAIGWSVLLAHFVCIPYTGCGINPARSFGPHMVNLMAGNKVGEPGWWVFYTAPFVGGAFASLIYKFLFVRADDAEDEAKYLLKETKPFQEEVDGGIKGIAENIMDDLGGVGEAYKEKAADVAETPPCSPDRPEPVFADGGSQ